ncbi:MAG TPA: AAA family ATPase [Anaerolineaceae bacterium]|nr:AAA family ATPase [Anaerolineaceae bacterium]
MFHVGEISRSNVAIGDGATVIVNHALSAADEARAQENFEREKLANAVAALVDKLYRQVRSPQPINESPYISLLPFDLADAQRFYGRDAAIDQLLNDLLCDERLCRLVILHGDAGIGKTSLLRAGVEPALISGQHLPLYVRVTTAPLIEQIKRSLLPTLDTMPIMKGAPLTFFVHQLAEVLPEGKHIFVLLDQFEIFFTIPEEERHVFIAALSQCLIDEPSVHWLISVRSVFYGHLQTFAQSIDQPMANSFVLAPLTREESRLAIVEPARAKGISFEEGLVDKIIVDLGGDAVDPSRLQQACQTLVGRSGPDDRQVKSVDYQHVGGVAGVLHHYLDLVLESNFLSADRFHAWQILAILAEQDEHEMESRELVAEMKEFGVDEESVRRLLIELESNRLLRQKNETWQLASDQLVERIRKWSNARAVLVQARQEVGRQLKQIRDSSLRGLLGGALGFSLAYLVCFVNQVEETSFLGLLMMYRALPGAMAGFLLIFVVDMAQAIYHDRRRWLRWLTGCLAGAGAFMTAMIFHGTLNLAVVSPLALLGFSVEGAIWGAIAGIGTQWASTSSRPYWQTLGVVSVACALGLLIGENIGHAMQRPRIQVVSGAPFPWQVLAAGALMPLLIIIAALFGRRSRYEEE